jgi:hypothetical protein
LAPQPRLGQINVALNATQDFIIDQILIAEPNDGPALNLERFVRKPLVFRRKKAERGAGTFWFRPRNLLNVVFIFDAQPFQRVSLRGVAFRDAP